MSDVTVSPDEVARRTVRHADWVPCKSAFIDARTPGSDLKDNYAFIGRGVSQNPNQFVNLSEPHGFNLGAAGMPNGVTNSLHLHFTAEVFINFGGDYQLRWGADGDQGQYRSVDGDVISVPTWIFRGFTNVGADEGILLTVLGGDDTGGILWGPDVIAEAGRHGLYLTVDGELIDTAEGGQVPAGARLVSPMPQEEIERLDRYTNAEFAGRVVSSTDREWTREPFLCSRLPGGGAELCSVIGYGMVEDRRSEPRIHEPHGFDLAWLRARPGDGILTHRHTDAQVLTCRSGRWAVRLNTGADTRTVELGRLDSLSVPAGAWRSITLVDAPEEGTGELLVINSGDARTHVTWAPEVVDAARDAGSVLDANRYLAPAAALAFATVDD